jgi:glutaredoxin
MAEHGEHQAHRRRVLAAQVIGRLFVASSLSAATVLFSASPAAAQVLAYPDPIQGPRYPRMANETQHEKTRGRPFNLEARFDEIARPAVIIYGAPWCGPCHQAAAYLRERGVSYVEKDVELDPSAARDMSAGLERAGIPAAGIPVLDVRGRMFMGFDEAAIEDELGIRRLYVSFSPAHLLASSFEMTTEVRVHRSIGLAVIAGYGAAGASSAIVWALGGQVIGYPFRRLRGLQIGAEVLHSSASGKRAITADVLSYGDGLQAGGFVGVKRVLAIGFTFSVQAGAAYVLARPTTLEPPSRLVPLANLNVGWTF